MSQSRDDLAVVISASTEQLASDLARGAAMFRKFAKDVQGRQPQFSVQQIATAPFKAAAAAVNGVTSSLRSATASMAQFASRTLSTTAGMAMYSAGVNGVSGAFAHLKDAVSMAADLEETTLAFEVMLGSAERATSVVADLRKFAAQTPFDTKGTLDAARQLMAYGVAADQITPSLRVLGDITSGLGGTSTLGDMAYLFGTLKTQGRAFSKDIYQFTNRGVDLLQPLAKQFGVTTGEVMKLVEEGRVGFPQVAKAMESLRGPGGKFENMMGRQSKTLKGMWQVAKDSFDIAKTKLGQIIIEEVGLKEAASDFDNFAKRLEANMDRVRPVVRFLGDLGKAVAQVGYEFGRASIQFGEIFGKQLELVIPQAGTAFRSFHQILKDAAHYKVDPIRVAEFSTSLGELLINSGITLVETIYDAGTRINKYFIQPLLVVISELKGLIGSVNGAFSSVWMPGSTRQGNWFNEQRFGIRMPDDNSSEDEILETWRTLRGEIKKREAWRANGSTLEDMRARLSLPELYIMQEKFLKRYDFDPAAFAHLNMGWVPDRELLRQHGGGRDNLDWNLERLIPEMRENAKGLKELKESLLANIRAQEQAKEDAADAAFMAASTRRIQQLLDAKANLNSLFKAGDFPLMGMGGFPGIGDLANPLRSGIRMEAMQSAHLPLRLNPLTSALAQMLHPIREDLLSFPFEPSQSAIEAANRIKDEYDPARRIRIEKSHLEEALKHGLINRGQFELGYRDLVKSAADKLGIGGPTQLPNAALVGTAEDAELIARWMTRGGARTTEELLAQLVRLAERQVELAAADHIAPMPRVVNINP